MHCVVSCVPLSVVLRSPLSPGLFQIRPRHTRPRLRCSEPETSTTENDPPVESSPDPFGLDSMMEEVKDSQELGSRGEGWMLSIAIACALLMFPPVNLFGLISALGWIGASTGFVLCVYSIMSLGKSNFPLPYPRKNAEFVERGIYAHVRHPMYGGILLLGFGLAAITRNEVNHFYVHFC